MLTFSHIVVMITITIMILRCVFSYSGLTTKPSLLQQVERRARGKDKQRHESRYVCHTAKKRNSDMNAGCDERVCICQGPTEDMQYTAATVQRLLRFRTSCCYLWQEL